MGKLRNLSINCVVFAILLALISQFGVKARGLEDNTPGQGVPIRVLRQNNDIRFEHLALEDGLSQSVVHEIVQDREGFLWVATQDGLNRYDGYDFVIYKHDPGTSHSLSSNWINTLFIDSDGDLWIGTQNGGLNLYDRMNDQFIHYEAATTSKEGLNNNNVNVIFEDHLGILWVGTDAGINIIDKKTGSMANLRQDANFPLVLSYGIVTIILEEENGFMWFGTQDGLVRYDRLKNSSTRFRNNPDEIESLADNQITGLVLDEHGAVWVGTANGGISIIKKGENTFTHHQFIEGRDGLSDNHVSVMMQDTTGTIWVGFWGGGMDRIDPKEMNFTHYNHQPGDGWSMSSNYVYTIFEDQAGVMWVGTWGGGLNKFSRLNEQFTTFRSHSDDRTSLPDRSVWSVYQEPSGILWIGTLAGLDRVDRNTGETVHFRHQPGNLGSIGAGTVRAISRDSFGMLWVGTEDGGINLLKPGTNTFTHYQSDSKDPGSLGNNMVLSIYENRAGRIFIGTFRGLNEFDRKTQKFIHIKTNPNDPGSLSDSEIWCLIEDNLGNLWIGTANGLYKYNLDTRRSLRFRHDPAVPGSLSDDRILALHVDLNGFIWIGTLGGGLNRYDPIHGAFESFRERDGLPNDTVYGILEDQAGNLWLSTNRGLSKFDPESRTFHNYTISDGLPSNEYNKGASFQDGYKELFFGGIDGLTTFRPEDITEDPFVPPVVLTAFTQGGEVYRPAGALPSLTEVRLGWPNNYFEFEFAALSFAQPEANQYTYILENFDKDWIKAGSKRFGRYTNLPGGTYYLRVKGSNQDGKWNNTGQSVKIVVVPPLWATWWFQSILVGLLVVGVFTGYRLRIRSIEARAGQLETQVVHRTAQLRQEIEQRLQAEEALKQSDLDKAVAAERSRLARELHDAVTQTIFSASLIAEALPAAWEINQDDGHKLLGDLKQLTRGALAEMRTLLLELRPSALLEASMPDLLRQLAEAAIGREGIKVTTFIEGTGDLPDEVHIALYRILQEAMNNIVKHARATQVSIRMRYLNDATAEGRGDACCGVILSITDNGRGFKPEVVLPDRMGLSIMRERAEAISAILTIESQPGQGTQVTVLWENGHPSAKKA